MKGYQLERKQVFGLSFIEGCLHSYQRGGKHVAHAIYANPADIERAALPPQVAGVPILSHPHVPRTNLYISDTEWESEA